MAYCVLVPTQMDSRPQKEVYLLGCPWNLVTILSKLGCFTYLGNLQPTYIGLKESIY